MAIRRCARRLQQQQGGRGGGGGGRGGSARSITGPGGQYTVPAYTRPPRADLLPTRIERGTGLNAADPVNRIKPNLESHDPEPSVLRGRVDGRVQLFSPTDVSTTAAERARDTSLTLAQWFGTSTGVDGRCALIDYLESQQQPDALPLPRHAQAALKKFEEQDLPQLCQEHGLPDANLAKEQWRSTAYRYTSQLLLFNTPAFDAHLHSCDHSVKTFFNSESKTSPNKVSSSSSDATVTTDDDEAALLSPIADILRRDAQLKRNQALQELIDVARSAALQGGQTVWSRFFALVDTFRAELVDSDDTTAAMYDLCAAQQPPAVKPVVALLFAIVTSSASSALLKGQLAGATSTTAEADTPVVDAHLLTRDEVLRFVAPRLPAVLRSPHLHAFSQLGLTDTTSALASAVAARQTARDERRSKAKEIAGLFGDMKSAESMIARVVNASRDDPDAIAATAHVQAVLRTKQLQDGPAVEKAMRAADWKANYRAIATDLLSSREFVRQLRAALAAELSTASKTRAAEGALLTEATKAFLDAMIAADNNFESMVKDTVTQQQQRLLESAAPNVLLRILRAHNVDLQALQSVATARKEAIASEKRVKNAKAIFELLVIEVWQRHPKWFAMGVLNLQQDTKHSPDSAPAVRVLLNIYLRLSYVPSTGAALLAQRYRGRIGPIAKDETQTNLEAEIGFAEHYDMFEYKRYDWQGWYQRMVDIHNRNVSIRCKLSNLRVLDNQRRPFIDLQTERRLRILAGERVGNGMVKLDNDRFEDHKDNLEFGEVKIQDLFSEAKKAQLGEQYWPSVEVKVRRPSGQTRLHYSVLDWERVEQDSKTAFESYTKLKASTLFVPPTATWLRIGGTATATSATQADAEGYTVDALFESLGAGDATGKGGAATTP
jgi:hypothetical protein